MRRKWWPAVALVGALAGPGCSGDTKPAPGKPCVMNTDCQNPLSCTFGKCHQECVEARDCPAGELCAKVTDGNVCVLPVESKCGLNSQCPEPLVCGKDLKCRNQCATARDCATSTQQCVLPDGVCAEPADIDSSGQLKLPDGGAPDTRSADGGPDAAAAAGDATSPMTDAGADAPVDAAAAEAGPSDAGVLGFVPSNFVLPPPSTADGGAPSTVAVSNVSCDLHCLPPSLSLTMLDGSVADLYLVQSLRIDTTAVLRLSSPHPIVIAALDTVDIEGQLLVNATADQAGPGGFSSGVASPGAGAAGGTAADADSGGAGGSYCGAGGLGGAAMGATAMPGKAYGTPEIVPLVGGSPGGVAAYYGIVAAGGGGGAVQIVSATSIKLGMFGVISAGGGGGMNPASGGGSGGAILLEAPAITVAGHLAANGGGGGGIKATTGGNPASGDDQPAAGGMTAGSGSAGTMLDGGNGGMDVAGGGGGAGRIRLNSAGGAATIQPGAIISPALGSPCATQGSLGG